ncbi:MAG: FprA family A-type flavoprotein [Candidatus Korarchaeota archaeon]|nr:FprA family A-type flavoprotein [Candidatus Korarchaeota archaeon]
MKRIGLVKNVTEVLVVYHSMGGNTEQAARYLTEGVKTVEGVDVTLKEALKAHVDDLRNCDGIAIGTPDYFSYMAGAVKDFFDRTYYPTKGEVSGTPCVLFVSHGGGGKAVKSLEEMVETFKFKQITTPLLLRGAPNQREQEELRDAGKKLAKACQKNC